MPCFKHGILVNTKTNQIKILKIISNHYLVKKIPLIMIKFKVIDIMIHMISQKMIKKCKIKLKIKQPR